MKNNKKRILILPGDGIGPEVISEAIKTLSSLAKRHNIGLYFEEFAWGCGYYLQHGEMMPAEGIDTLSAFDAVLFGAVGDPRVPEPVSISGLSCHSDVASICLLISARTFSIPVLPRL